LQISEEKIYALMLFDHALIQVGGIPFQSRNKIVNFGDGVLLAYFAGALLRRVAPEWFESE